MVEEDYELTKHCTIETTGHNPEFGIMVANIQFYGRDHGVTPLLVPKHYLELEFV